MKFVLERGQGLVEYSLVLVLIAVVVILGIGLLGTSVNGLFNTINTKISGTI